MMPADAPDPTSPTPRVSVVLTTYKRLDLLPRAIDCILNQTFADWELIISDDEDPAGETWAYLQQLVQSKNDPRIRISRNPAPHGQCGNVNNALRQARAPWIKFLFDDDLLRLDCLEQMLAAIDAASDSSSSLVLACCNMDEYRDGVLSKSGHREGPAAVVVPRAYAPVFSLRGEPVAGGVPTQLMIHRSVVEAGILFEQPPELVSGVDAYFVLRARTLGDNLIVNRVLAELHQGGHETVTSGMKAAALDREFDFLVKEQYARRDPDVPLASLSYFRQATRITRAIHRLRTSQLWDAFKLSITCWHPGAWWTGLRTMWVRQSSSLPLTKHHRVVSVDTRTKVPLVNA